VAAGPGRDDAHSRRSAVTEEAAETIALLEARAAELEQELQQEIARSQRLHDNWMGVVRRLVNIIGGSK